MGARRVRVVKRSPPEGAFCTTLLCTPHAEAPSLPVIPVLGLFCPQVRAGQLDALQGQPGPPEEAVPPQPGLHRHPVVSAPPVLALARLVCAQGPEPGSPGCRLSGLAWGLRRQKHERLPPRPPRSPSRPATVRNASSWDLQVSGGGGGVVGWLADAGRAPWNAVSTLHGASLQHC